MPGMDGFELIRNAKTIHPDLRTIMITGFPSDEVKSKAKEERVDGLFSKPIDWDEPHILLDTLSGSERVQNVRKGKGLYRAERILLAIVLFILIIFGIQPLEAQPPFHHKDKPMLRMDGQDSYWRFSDLGLTEDQKKTLESLQRAYASEALPLRMKLMSSRFELRHLIRDPNVQSKLLFDRQKKISELQARLDDLSLSYQIKARSIFTKEQLEQLPPDFSMGMELGSGMGIGTGKGPQELIR
jgi:YesN/AraC family two-component response regulator